MDSLLLHVDEFWTSPYVFSVFVCLREKGIPFETRPVSLAAQAQKSPQFRTLSITARVPVLEHGAFILSESSAIVEYLEETCPAPQYTAMLPASPGDRARARQIMAWIRSDLMPIREERPTSTIFYEPAKTPLSPAGREAAEKLIQVASAFIPDGRTSLFDTFSVADADLTMMLQRLIANGEPVPEKLRAFAAVHWNRPSVRAFIDRQRPPFVPY